MKHFFFIISMLLGSALYAQTGEGEAAAGAVFREVVSEVESHYAGFFDKVTPATRPSYDAMVEELRAGVSGRNVEASIGKYIGWFQDLHLCVLLGGKRLVSYERRPVNYADSMAYKPQSFAGRVDENCFLIRIPSMRIQDGARKFIERTVRKYKRSGCVYLIIDLRGNSGGADGVYLPLVELAYDHPAIVKGTCFRNTEKNRAFLLEGMKGNRSIQEALEESAGQRNTLAMLRGDNLRSFKKVSSFPRRIAVLIDNQVASNAEHMILDLQGVSNRVVLYGRDSSLGAVDYVNPRPFAVPSLDLVVMIPTCRSGRLPEHPIDPDGIAPEVMIPLPLPEELTDNIDTWTRWVAGEMRR